MTFVAPVTQRFRCAGICGAVQQVRTVGTVQVTQVSVQCDGLFYHDIKMVFHLCSSLLVIQVAVWPNPPCGTPSNGFVVGGTGTVACAAQKRVQLQFQTNPETQQDEWVVSVCL